MGTLRVYKGKENQVLGITFHDNEGNLYAIRRGFKKHRYPPLTKKNLRVEVEAEVIKENKGRVTLRTKDGMTITLWRAK